MYFLTHWGNYIEATKVNGKDCVTQLLKCFDEELRKDLTWSAGGRLTNKMEYEVFAAIKTLAVCKENTMVARVASMKCVKTDETIRSFGARVRGPAGVCKYLLNCPTCSTEVKYTDHILHDVIARVISDSEMQLELLGHMNQNMTPEEVFLLIKAKEAGKRSTTCLHETQGVESP